MNYGAIYGSFIGTMAAFGFLYLMGEIHEVRAKKKREAQREAYRKTL